jgi:hypothetical protein
MTMTTLEAVRTVTGGVDTHLDVHVAAALDPIGTLLGSRVFETTPAGYKSLLDWLLSFGAVAKVGVEGTGSYGAGLARFLRKADVLVIGSTSPIELNAAAMESPTRSTRLRRLEQHKVVVLPASRKPKTVRSRPFGSW